MGGGLRIAVFGLGYVGTTSTACLAAMGHTIIGVDVNPAKVDLIARGKSPVLEPGVGEILQAQVEVGRVRATMSVEEALAEADAALIAVGTPSSRTGAIDDSHVVSVVREIARLRAGTGRLITIIQRSTCLPPTQAALIEEIWATAPGQPAAYAVHPEFLRAGQAVGDFYDPPKIIFGCSDDAAQSVCKALYPTIDLAPIWTDPMTAALLKYADNCFHAVKVTFANEIGMLAKGLGVDGRKVMELVCADTKLNISPYYLKPGFAFGGSCLPKDLRAVLAWSQQNFVPVPMLESVLPSNTQQVERVVEMVKARGSRVVGVFGLAFKDKTDDVRESPMVRVAEQLLGSGRRVGIYDPCLSVNRLLGANRDFALATLPHLAELLHDEPADVVAPADTILVCRNFPEVRWAELPWRMNQLVIDLAGSNDLGKVSVAVDGLHWQTDAPMETVSRRSKVA